MKIGLPVFNDRVSPVFDWARNLMIVQMNENGDMGERRTVEMGNLGEWERVALLVSEGVNVLICAGICGSLLEAITGRGIQVLPGIVGQVDDVLEAFKEGRLAQPQFCMPGYQMRRRRGHGRLKRSNFGRSEFGRGRFS